jgi:hypothetical protein
MKLPLARLEAGQPKAAPRRAYYMPAREHLDLLYGALSAEGRQALLRAALDLAKEEGLSEGDAPLIRAGKK